MTLLDPEFLILLLPLVWLWIRRRNRRERSKRPCRPSHTARDMRLLLLALAFLTVALARPAIPRAHNSEKVQGHEAIIALDLSYSMRAHDLRPSRLEAAMQTIETLLRRDPNDRFALYGFTTQPLILSPPTTDHRLLRAALDALVIDNILTHGTSLKRLLRHIAARPEARKNVLLFSDGGEERDLEALVRIAKKGHIRIVAVGMASQAGSLLETRSGEKLTTSSGALVISRLNPILADLAERTGGAFVPFRSVHETADAVEAALARIAKSGDFTLEARTYKELFWIPLLGALMVLVALWLRLPAKVAALLPFLALHTDAGVLDWYYIDHAKEAWKMHRYAEGAAYLDRLSRATLQSRFDQALMLYKQGRYRDAISILEPLKSKNPRLKQRILYLLGNAYARRGAYDKARWAYVRALALSDDPDIRHNLALIADLIPLHRKKPPAFKKGGGTMKYASRSKKRHSRRRTETGKGARKRTSASHPLGYKAYELINKGYIHEKNPW